jgi:peptidoglycan DL-endopeptidase RipA
LLDGVIEYRSLAVLVRPRYRARILAITAVVTVALSVTVGATAGEAAAPVNPTNQQITTAQAQKNQLGAKVGNLANQVSVLQAKLDKLRGNAELAEQKVALAIQQLQQAQAAAAAAQKQVKTAQAAIVAAQQNFTDFIRASYMQGPQIGMTADLLTASDPESLLQHGADVHYIAENQLDVLGSMDRASVAKSNADAQARGAVQREAAAENNAEVAKTVADQAATEADQQEQQVSASLASTQQQLQSAQANLATLNHQRAAYNAYQAQQAKLRAEAAARALALAEQQNGRGSGNGGGVPVAPTPHGQWTPAAGQTAVNRAMAYIGWPYSFAAGNYDGPTYGVAVDFDSRNDAHVLGFDCSGLALYAWAPYIHLYHYAATQYLEAGSIHPDIASLMPGDLVFWSDDGTESGIGHVAIYIGNGNVIQAPFSGAFIEITPLNRVESGYYGATRPLT